jgi:4-hydroxy-tetrahydrodipicolinate reductase
MGARLVALASQDERFTLAAALEQSGHPQLGTDAGTSAGVGPLELPISDAPTGPLDVLIDFTSPEGSMHWLAFCKKQQAAIVMGSTGHSADQSATIRNTAADIPILKASNMSAGMNVMFKLAAQIAAALGDGTDIEIAETHHRFKADAPSGTALTLRDHIAQATGRDPQADVVFGRQGHTGQRPARQIGMHALRLGDTVGEHEVHFGTLGETLTLKHSAHTRDTFVQGALRAAAWIAHQPPGLYDMHDVLNLK